MRRILTFILAAVGAIALLAASPPPARAQTDDPATWHPCMDAIRCFAHRDTTEYQKRETGTALYVLSTSAVVLSNVVWQWDTDRGGYPDVFYRDKALSHAASAALLTEGAIAMHVRPSFAVIWTNVAGLGFEISQGYVNPHDLAANAVGSLAGYALARWLNPIRFR